MIDIVLRMLAKINILIMQPREESHTSSFLKGEILQPSTSGCSMLNVKYKN
jgi:hypothetical protein